MFFIKVVCCSLCGFTARNQDWKPNRQIRLSHRDSKGQDCKNEYMTVRVIVYPYPTMFRTGETCRVFAPGTLRFKRDDQYPLRRLHERKTIVTVLEEGPDAQGIVMVKPPFDDDLPVLYSVLKRI